MPHRLLAPRRGVVRAEMDAEGTAPLGSTRAAVAARARAWSCFTAFAVGIAVSRWFGRDPVLLEHVFSPLGDTPLSPLAFSIAGLLASVVLVARSAVARPAILLGVVLLGAGVHQTRIHERPRSDLLRVLGPASPGDAPLLVRLEGIVLDTPSREGPRPGSIDEALQRFSTPLTRFALRIDTRLTDAGAVTVSGLVNVYAGGLDLEGTGSVAPGDRVRLTGLLHRPRPAMNPGQADPVAWANQSGRSGWVRTNAGAIEKIEHRRTLERLAVVPRALSAQADASASRLIGSGAEAHSPASAVLGAMLLGERSDETQQAVFVRTGVAHLLAISGFHLAVLVGLTVGLIRLTGDRHRVEAIVGLLVIASYVSLVPARTPIVRAAMLAGAMLIAHFFSRRWDKLALLGWVATALLAWRPLDLFGLGFQLTVGVTALLLWLSGQHHPWLGGRRDRRAGERSLAGSAGHWARSLVVTSVLVWLAASPVIIFHTGVFNPLTPIAVVCSTPVATLVQILGMGGLVASLVSEGVGGVFMQAAGVCAGGLAWIAGAFDRLAFSSTLAPVSAAWSFVATGVVLYAIRRARLLDPRPWLAGAGVAVWLAIEIMVSSSLPRGVAARIDMLSVGDGTCILVRSGDDALLWDAGSLTPGLGTRTIPRALRALGSPSVPTAIVTHANMDHYGALPDAAPLIGLERVLMSRHTIETMEAAPAGSAERIFLDAMRGRGVEIMPVEPGRTIGLGRGTLHILWPPDDQPTRLMARNDRSIVARLDVPTPRGVRRVLLTGDIQRAAMMLLLDSGAQVSAEIVELPHHGSHIAAAEYFLTAVGPSVVLQSTGPSRLGDARWADEREGIVKAGGEWHVTAGVGACWAQIHRDGRITSGGMGDRR